MLACTTQKSLFPSAGCSSELIKKPVDQGKAGASCWLCRATGRSAQNPKLCPPQAPSRSLLPGTRRRNCSSEVSVGCNVVKNCVGLHERNNRERKGVGGWAPFTSVKCKKKVLLLCESRRPQGSGLVLCNWCIRKPIAWCVGWMCRDRRERREAYGLTDWIGFWLGNSS